MVITKKPGDPGYITSSTNDTQQNPTAPQTQGQQLLGNINQTIDKNPFLSGLKGVGGALGGVGNALFGKFGEGAGRIINSGINMSGALPGVRSNADASQLTSRQALGLGVAGGVEVAPFILPGAKATKPVGNLFSGANLARYIPNAVEGAAYAGSAKAASNLQENKPILEGTGKSSLIGAGINTIVPFVAEATGRTYKAASRFFSNTPKEITDRLENNPEVWQQVKDYASGKDTPNNIKNDLIASIKKASKSAQDEYGKALAYADTVDANKFNKNDLLAEFNRIAKDAKIKINTKTGIFDFSGSKFNNEHSTLLTKIREKVLDWPDNTAVGMNELKQALGAMYPKDDALGQKFVISLKDTIDTYLAKTGTGLDVANKTYGVTKNKLDDLLREFSAASSKSKKGTQTNLLNSVFNNKNTELLNMLKGIGKDGENVLDKVAAARLVQWTPQNSIGRLLSRIGIGAVGTLAASGAGTLPAVLATGLEAAASSPRILGAVTKGMNDLRPGFNPMFSRFLREGTIKLNQSRNK